MLSPETDHKKKSINHHSSQNQIRSGGVLYKLQPENKTRCSITEPVVLLKSYGNKQSSSEKGFPFGRKSLDHSYSSEFSIEKKGRASPQNIEELVIRKIRIEQIFRREKSPIKFERSSSNPANIYAYPSSSGISSTSNTSVRSPPQKPKRNFCFMNKIEMKVSPTRENPLKTRINKEEPRQESKLSEDIRDKKDKKTKANTLYNALAEPNEPSHLKNKARPRSKSRLRPMSPIERTYNSNIRFLNTIERPKSLDEDDHLYTLKMVQIPPNQRNVQSPTQKKSIATTTHNQEAIDSFGQIYKNVLREKELVELKISEQTPIRAILFHENSVNSLPLKYGIVKKRTNSKQAVFKPVSNLQPYSLISLILHSHYHLGDRGINGFCVGLKQLKNLQSLNLKENGLSEIGIDNVLSCLNQNLQELDVSSNEVSFANIKKFFETFDISNVQLHTIKINRAQITDETADCLFTGLQYFKTLKILQLNGNRISNRSCYSIEDMIELLPNLQELDLSWNIIQSEGGTLILDASRKQNTLQILNLAENLLGFGENPTLFNAAFSRLCSGEGSKPQLTSSSITDLNMSYNQFSQKQSNKLLSIKQKNTSISNFNFQGNVIETIPKFETSQN